MHAKPGTIPLTLIIPVRDRQYQLDRALASVARQDTLPTETLVVDDGSAANVAIAGEFRERLNIRLIRHEKNKGAAAARNTGMQAADTEWISFLDSDDCLLVGSLATRWSLAMVDQSRRSDGTILYGCGWIDCGEDGTPIAARWPRPSADPDQFASGCWFSPGSCLIFNRRTALERAGPQDETMRRFEDVDWFLSLALKGFSLAVLPVAAVAIERTRRQDPQQIEQAAQVLRTKWTKKGLDPQKLRRLDSYIDLERAAANYFAGFRTKALMNLAKSFLKHPRRNLQLSPGWEIESIRTMPEASLTRKKEFVGLG
ncbi:glycosyltransferase involved in cell wall biosynthesis [Mesorhizobium robiniae]|uniref:Glycosyltransferase involved in cell wall biosynthesis n=1 Tax=Mesorhizobium robiniae TaxID=559315 RepID=A0ABV2GPE5_9HYPH